MTFLKTQRMAIVRPSSVNEMCESLSHLDYDYNRLAPSGVKTTLKKGDRS